MRLITKVHSHPEYRRLMLYQTDAGVYLFFYNSDTDAPCNRDDWFDDLESAQAYIADEFGIYPEEWQIICDPIPGCQDDFIQPVRIKGRAKGSPDWGSFEILVDTKWVDYIP